MNTLLYILNTLMLALSAYCLAYTPYALYDRLQKTLLFFVLFVFEIIVALGFIFKNITVMTATASSLLITAAVLLSLKQKRTIFASLTADMRTLASFAFLRPLQGPALKIIFYATGVALIFKFAVQFFLIPIPSDGTYYHLPVLVDYIQQGRIFLTEKILWSNCYPRNIEMLNLWQLLFFRSGFLVNMPQFLMTLCGGIAVYGILRENSIRKELSLLGGMLFLCTPVVLAQMSSAFVDTSLAAMFFLCLYFLLRYHKEQTHSVLFHFSLALGFLLGIKYTSIAYYWVFLAALLLLLAHHRKGIIMRFLSVLLVSGAVGGVWYAFNYYLFDNPFFPNTVSLFGTTFFRGIDVNAVVLDSQVPALLTNKNEFLKVIISWIGIDLDALRPLTLKTAVDALLHLRFDERIGGIGVQWLLLILPAAVVWGYRRFRQKQFSISEAGVIFIPLLCFLLTPNRWWARLGACVIIAGVYGFTAYLNESARPRPWLLRATALCVLLSCVQGTFYDAWHLKYVMGNYRASGNAPLHSAYIQVDDPEYKPLFRLVNSGGPRSIVLLQPTVKAAYLYYWQGDRTQNSVRLIPSGGWGEHIANEQEYHRLLSGPVPDYLISPSEYNSFVENDARFKLLQRLKDGSSIYEREMRKDWGQTHVRHMRLRGF